MNDLREALSRLLDGDLSDAEAASLHERIAAEPEVAAAWKQLVVLRDDLDSMPVLQPPAGLDDRILAAEPAPFSEPVPRPANTARWIPLAGWLAAAAAVFFLWPTAPAETLLIEGSQVIEGDAHLLAGDAHVFVKGRAEVTVEPPTGFVREPSREGEMSTTTTHLAAALTGAVITVTVYEGTARIDSPELAGETITAGETRTFGTAHAAVRNPAAVPTPDPVPSAIAPETKAELRARIHSLEGELERARFEAGLTRGQLVRLEGEPQAWPAGVPAYLEPDTFTSRLYTALDTRDIGEILEVDCEEYPCIAYIETHVPMDTLHDEMEGVIDELADDDEAPAMQTISRRKDGDEVTTVLGVAVLPPNPSQELDDRTGYRAMSTIEDIGLTEDPVEPD